ncbi:MAG: hypothetical protein IJ333_07485 [Clostridia bacterium]|nr:hypothetical protein [Clostridia bacterium]
MIKIYIKNLPDGVSPHQAGRALLAEVLGQEPQLVYGSNGKPYFAQGDLFFNLSHCKGAVGVAIGKQELGFDLEDSNRTIVHTGFALPEEAGIEPLLLWVLKESFVKWTGDGVSILRKTKVTALDENIYEGKYQEKKAFLQAFQTKGLVGSLATEKREEYQIIYKF